MGESEVLVNAQTRNSGSWADMLWQADAQALLVESHLATWTHSDPARTRFVSSLHRYLATQPDTESWLIGGDGSVSLATVAEQLSVLGMAGPVRPALHGPTGIVAALRSRGSEGRWFNSRFRYIIWHGVDAVISRDRALFESLADALLGVSAELEFGGETLSLLQRVIFVGGERLRECAGDRRGPLHRWRRDGAATPFWQLVSGLAAPSVLSHSVERLLRGGVMPELDLTLD